MAAAATKKLENSPHNCRGTHYSNHQEEEGSLFFGKGLLKCCSAKNPGQPETVSLSVCLSEALSQVCVVKKRS